jgi:hypothetical protein
MAIIRPEYDLKPTINPDSYQSTLAGSAAACRGGGFRHSLAGNAPSVGEAMVIAVLARASPISITDLD